MTDHDLMIKIIYLEERITQLNEDGLDTQEVEEELQALRETAGSAA